MITGRGVNPFDPRGLGVEGVALNSSGGPTAASAADVVAAATEEVGAVAAASAGLGPGAAEALRGKLGVR